MKIPPAVRVLPMDEGEFDGCSIDDIQDEFFSEDLPFRPDGRYRHYKYGLDTVPGAIVLFQYRAVIVASATFTGRTRFSKPDKGGYHGALYFDTESIRTFDPVSPDTVRGVWPRFRRFSHAKLRLDPERYPKFRAKLKHVQRPKA